MSLKLRLKYIILIFLLNAATYFGIQNIVEHHTFDFLLPIDARIPLVPEFIWIYTSLIPVLIITSVCLVKSKRAFYTMAGGFILATMALDISYILLPSFYPRETLAITSASTWLLDLTRQIDGSNNTFPSGHVTLSWLLFWSVTHTKYMSTHHVGKLYYGLWALGISISTLTLKQHYIIDVIGGFLLALMCYFGAKWLLKDVKIQESPQKEGALDFASEAQLAE